MTGPQTPPRQTSSAQDNVAQVERRADLRFSVNIPVELTPVGASSLHLTASNLSRHGCYLEMPNPLSVGTRVRVALSLGEQIAQARGCVITRHPDLGNGIMFLTFEEDGQRTLRRYLEHLAGDYPS
jgi:PilZ domain-containing protein